MRLIVGLFGVLLGLTACGESFSGGGGSGAAAGGITSTTSSGTTTTSEGGSGAGGTGQGGNGEGGTAEGGSGQGGGPSVQCPPTRPADGSMCSPGSPLCSYGDSLDPNCRATVQCNGTEWNSFEPAGICRAPAGEGCPEVSPGDEDAQCTNAMLNRSCEYPASDTYCYCTDQVCTGGSCITLEVPYLRCFAGPTAANCPPTSPNLGAECGNDAAICAYLGGYCQEGWTLKCLSGTWQLAPNAPCTE